MRSVGNILFDHAVFKILNSSIGKHIDKAVDASGWGFDSAGLICKKCIEKDPSDKQLETRLALNKLRKNRKHKPFSGRRYGEK